MLVCFGCCVCIFRSISGHILCIPLSRRQTSRSSLQKKYYKQITWTLEPVDASIGWNGQQKGSARKINPKTYTLSYNEKTKTGQFVNSSGRLLTGLFFKQTAQWISTDRLNSTHNGTANLPGECNTHSSASDTTAERGSNRPDKVLGPVQGLCYRAGKLLIIGHDIYYTHKRAINKPPRVIYINPPWHASHTS